MASILGINAYHGDSSACLVIDGKLVAAVEEERFRREKHWAGFPELSIKWCLDYACVSVRDVEHIAISRNPRSQLHKKIWFAAKSRRSITSLWDRASNARAVMSVKSRLKSAFPDDSDHINPKSHSIEHHRAHSASAFLVSPFDDAAVVSIDAFGDFRSSMTSTGTGSKLNVHSTIDFPHSLGIAYTAVTQFLGFPKYGDEYKVMGLAAYGKPAYVDELRKMIEVNDSGSFSLNLGYFLHTSASGSELSWFDEQPEIGQLFSPNMVKLLGPSRDPRDPVDDRHKDIAHSLQAVLEEAYFAILNRAARVTGKRKLTLAGGVGYNSVANGKIFEKTTFDDVYIQAAAGDAGTAIGAAFAVENQVLGRPREFVMENAYWGPEYDDETLLSALKSAGLTPNKFEDKKLFPYVAEKISEGNVIGWFQGRMEWGPRALGNRSILADPRRADIRELLNVKVKRRESFRPFAPSILEEAVGEYFEESMPDPFMLKVYPVRKEKQDLIPSVVHVDGSGRLQSVSKKQNPRYWSLIKAFDEKTGIPILLNTSFNENEPIVCTPEEGIAAYLRTNMDMLVLGNFVVERGQ